MRIFVLLVVILSCSNSTAWGLPGQGDEWAQAVTFSFERYWSGGSLDVLETELAELVGPENAASGDDLYVQVESLLQQQGYGALVSPPAPTADLLIWNPQASQQLQVELTDTRLQVELVLVEEPISQGWLHHRTNGLESNSGWISQGKLHCFEWMYNPNDESFRVSLLQHEARHLADLQAYNGMSAVDMEYRAKLTELAFAYHTTYRLLDRFSAFDKTDTSAHAQANRKVIQDLAEGLDHPENWRQVSVYRINQTARKLLETVARPL